MHAIRVAQFGGPEVLEFVEVEDLAPTMAEVLVRIEAAGVNPFDTHLRDGAIPSLPLPYTPGSDGAGVVEAIGAEVTEFAVGDPVYVFGSKTGTYAEKCLADQATVWHRPASISAEQGAAIGVPYGTAYHALFQRAKAKPGEIVLIHGASGGVGIAAIQLAKHARLTVYGTAGTKEGMALVKAQGADSVFNHHSLDYVEQIKACAEPKGVAIILEMVADLNLQTDLEILGQRGRVVIIGSHGPTEIDPRALMMKELDMMGMLLNKVSISELVEIHEAFVPLCASGVIAPVIGKQFALSEAAEAQIAVMKSGAHGKIVLTVSA